MANSYAKNKYVTITATFAVSGVATDPTTVTLKVQNPAGITTSYTYALAEVTKLATGIYSKTIQLSSSGYWAYQWVGTGTVADSTIDYYMYAIESTF
jgi:hypothetical protein